MCVALSPKDMRPTMTIRQEFAARTLNLGGLGLELGAYDRPLLDPKQHRVEFLDYYSTDELKGFAARDGVNPSNIVQVSHVVKGDDFAADLPGRFDYLIASHVIEHIPDIVRWLKNAERALRPGGRVFLVVPDKRYTFDRLRPVTTLDAILKSHSEKRTRPPFDAVFENIYLFRHVDAAKVWDGGGPIEDTPGRYDVATALRIASTYYDEQDRSIHCQVFTSGSFLEIVDALFVRGIIGLKRVAFHDVWNPNNEFFVALERA